MKFELPFYKFSKHLLVINFRPEPPADATSGVIWNQVFTLRTSMTLFLRRCNRIRVCLASKGA